MSNQILAPFKSPYKISITQEYGNIYTPAQIALYGCQFHNGIDIVFDNDTPQHTFGTPCICPFETGTVVKVTFDDPHSTKGNGVTLQSPIIDGVIYQIVFWHTCEIKVKLGDKVNLGDTVCYVGNSGLCSPSRDILHPFNGAHCHFMLFKYLPLGINGNWILQNENNGANGAINARDLFDFTQCQETGVDTGFQRDMWSISDYVSWMSPDILVKYFKYLGF